eukprot:2639508-Karenia_brevis.AAC.1
MASPYAAAIVFAGFPIEGMNTSFSAVQEKSSYINGVVVYNSLPAGYFIYWQSPEQRWAICDTAHRDLVAQGQKLGFAYECMRHTGANPNLLAGRWDWMVWDSVKSCWGKVQIRVSIMSSEAAGAAIQGAAVLTKEDRAKRKAEGSPATEEQGQKRRPGKRERQKARQMAEEANLAAGSSRS